jgi:CheY-like chemotaxis protein
MSEDGLQQETRRGAHPWEKRLSTAFWRSRSSASGDLLDALNALATRRRASQPQAAAPLHDKFLQVGTNLRPAGPDSIAGLRRGGECRTVKQSDRPQRSRRVLVVDDDRDTAQIFAALIEAMHHEAAYVTDPLKATGVARSFRPDIAFLDLGMPKIDGYALAKMLRAMPELGALALIAVSGHDQPQDRERSRRAGFDAHVGKPLDAALLESILAQFG